MPKKIRGDRLVLALISVLRTLVVELSKRKILDAEEFASIVQQTAIAHRETGDPNDLALSCARSVRTCVAQQAPRLGRQLEEDGEIATRTDVHHACMRIFTRRRLLDVIVR